MFATNFVVKDSHLKYARGEDNLQQWSQSHSVATANTMTNSFCKTCGSLLYRRGTGFPNMTIMRVGTIDDFSLMETKLKPRVEQFTKDRVSWLKGAEGVKQVEGYHYGETVNRKQQLKEEGKL
jgi:hypothetical protein